MTQEEFKRLADGKRELELFLDTVKHEGFDAIGARKILFAHEFNSYITDKDLINEIVHLVQSKLDEINKKIEEL